MSRRARRNHTPASKIEGGDWPVCPIADMASPQRMGAALTTQPTERHWRGARSRSAQQRRRTTAAPPFRGPRGKSITWHYILAPMTLGPNKINVLSPPPPQVEDGLDPDLPA